MTYWNIYQNSIDGGEGLMFYWERRMKTQTRYLIWQAICHANDPIAPTITSRTRVDHVHNRNSEFPFRESNRIGKSKGIFQIRIQIRTRSIPRGRLPVGAQNFLTKKRCAPLFSRSFLDFCVLIIFERVSIPHYTRDVLPSKCAPILVCSSNRFVSMLNCLVKLSSGNVSTGN